jgi:hypothetical protein
VTGDFDDAQLAELASHTRFSPVRDIVANPCPSPSTWCAPDPAGVRMVRAG